jgi:YD repeat-containing protein
MKSSAARICYFLFFIVFAKEVNAQFLKPPVNIASPNAATLGQFGDIPVSLFTGLPSIDIPLHTFSQGEIQIPLTLSYHALGVRPDQHPGWTGLNWNLSTGGSISRKVNGRMDEHNYPVPTTEVNTGYYFNTGLTIPPANVSIKDYIISLSNESIAVNPHYGKDTQPDEFSFNFLNYSGKFYLDHQGQWVVKANVALKVTFDGTFIDPPFTVPYEWYIYNSNGYVKTFKKFTITDEAGIEYIFGNTTDAIEYSVPFFAQNNHWVANTWHLTQIKLTNGQQITFTYDYTKKTINNQLVRFDWVNSMYISLYNKVFTTTTEPGFLNRPCNAYTNELHGPLGPYAGELIAPVYLKSIEGLNEKIVFTRSSTKELRYDVTQVYAQAYQHWQDTKTYGSTAKFFPFLSVGNDPNGDDYPNIFQQLQWQQLDNFQVFNKSAIAPIKEVAFKYTKQDTERLTLLEVQQKGSEKAIPPYQFLYKTSIPLPAYLADRTDHWGFYNGKTASYLSPVDYYQYRQPDTNYVQAGILKTIVYPTRGRTDFEFEAHTYAKDVKPERDQLNTYINNPIAGGLRIKKITSHEPGSTQKPVTKNFYYLANYNATLSAAALVTLPSSGVLGGQAKYYWNNYAVRANNDPNYNYMQEVFSSHSILPASNNSQGSHIGYSEVVEKRTDGSYTIRKYTNFDNGRMDEPLPPENVLQLTRTIYDPYIDNSAKRGHLLSEEVYNPQDQPLSKKTFRYQAQSNREIRSISASRFNVCGGAQTVYEGYLIKYNTYQYKIDKEENYIYDQNDPTKSVATSTDYTYNSNGQPATVQNTQSDNSVWKTIYKYPFDYSASALGGTMGTLQSKHMLNRVIDQRVTRNDAAVSGTVTEYDAEGQPIKVYQLESEEPVTGLSYNTAQINPHASYFPLRTVLSYDGAKNLISQQQVNGQVNTAYLWGYASSLPTAEVKNATVDQIAYTSFETDTDKGNWSYTGAGVSGPAKTGQKYHTLSAANPLSLVLATAGTYRLSYWAKGTGTIEVTGGEVSQAEPPSAPDAGGWVLHQKKIIAPASTTLTLKVTAESVSLDEVRLLPLSALMTTYTYELLKGMTSATDAAHVTTYYEYDDFQRLVRIKDQDGNIVKHYVYHYKGE